MSKIRRGLAAAAVAGLTAAALVATSANAAIPVDGVYVDVDTDGVGPDTADGTTRQVKTVKDAGGVSHTFEIVWGRAYIDPAGTKRVSVPRLTVYRSDALTEAGGEPADSGADVHFDVSSHGTVRWTQHKLYDGIDLDLSTDDQVSFNPRNPISNQHDTFVRVSAGVDGDGKGNTPFVYFVQPTYAPVA